MNKLTFTLPFIFLYVSAIAGGPDLSADAIPAELKVNSNAIVRFMDVELQIRSARKADYSIHYAMTILKSESADEAILAVPYDDFSKIKRFSGIVYDRNGKKVEQIEKDKFYDFSAISRSSIYEDRRLKACRPEYMTVPFTVEYSFEIDFSGVLDFPDFYPLHSYNMATEKASLTVYTPDSIGVRYYLKNTSIEPLILKEKTTEILTWNFSNLPAVREEPFSPDIREISPVVVLAPLSFRIQKNWGSGDTWKSYGSWYFELIKDRDDLSPEAIAKIRDMVSSIPDTLEKVKFLYGYMQKKTRYTGVQEGIGGWQPAPASEVDRLCYGDCKGLTNYTKSLLKAAGIRSVYTLVMAGDNVPDVDASIPSAQFNHVILCVPVKKDTVWLECTSQVLPAGYIGTFTDDRHVLLITESGGYLVRTPLYDEKTNKRSTVGKAKLDADGNAVMELIQSNWGSFYDDTYGLLQRDDADRKKIISEDITASDFTLQSYLVKEDRSLQPRIVKTLRLSIGKMAVKAGETMLLLPNQITKEEDMASQVISRKTPILVRRSTLQVDTIYISLPEGFTMPGNNLNQTVNSKFGEYRATTSLEGNTIRYIRALTIYKGLYPPESYSDFLDFFEKVAVADNKKLALRKPAQ